MILSLKSYLANANFRLCFLMCVQQTAHVHIGRASLLHRHSLIMTD